MNPFNIVWALVYQLWSSAGEYTWAVPLAPQKCSVQSYVDHTKLFISLKMKDSSESFADLWDNLYRKGQWCSNNLLLLNPNKTKLMVFGSRQMRSRLITPRLIFVGRSIVPEHTDKDLWGDFAKHITKYASSCMSCQIKHTKHVFDKHTPRSGLG